MLSVAHTPWWENWPAITAIGTAATATILLGSAVFALWQIYEGVNTRASELLADLSRRWDEPLLRDARFAIGKRDVWEIAATARRMWVGTASLADERVYYEMTPLPNFLEALGVIEGEVSGISLPLVNRLWGGTILGAWDKWELAIRLIRRHSNNDSSYSNFEGLVNRLRRLRDEEAHPPAHGPTYDSPRYGLVIR